MFTCNTCMIQFQSGELQRYHMKTEWHRYNLKRRVAQLPPINADVFVQKLQASQKEQALNQVDEFGFPLLRPIMEKSRRHRKDGKGAKVTTAPKLRESESTFSVSSQLSKATVHSTDYGEHSASEYGFTTEDSHDELDSDYSSEETDTEQVEQKSSPVIDCIFCGAKYHNIEVNVEHMFKSHGLYIPERNYLANLNGLLKQIEYRVVVKNHCLCCKFKGVSLESIRAHIQSKSHCRIPYETKEERSLWAKFYSFAISEEVNYEHTSDAESVDHESTSNCAEDINSNYSVVHVDQSGVEMVLPTGARVGHRGMQRYYRQNLVLPSSEAESRRTLTAVDRRFNNGITVTEYNKNKKHMEFLEKQVINRSINRQVRRSNFQRHYRDELLQ